MSKKVSVVVPVFNAREYLADCVESLRAQTIDDLEVIFVDDGSSDGSADFLENVVSSDSRFHVVCCPENIGAYSARAKGMQAAKGDYIGFVDADDAVEPNMYEVLREVACTQAADIVICEAIERDAAGAENYRAKFGGTGLHKKDLLSSFCAGHFGTNAMWNKLYERRLIEKNASRPLRWRQDISEDAIINIGCFAEAKRVALVDRPLYRHNRNESSVTRDQDRLSIYIQLLRAYALALEQYRHFDSDGLQQVTDMFAKRLARVAHSIPHFSVDEKEQFMIADALELAVDIYPQGVLSLMTADWRSRVNNTTVKGAAIDLARASRTLGRAVKSLVLGKS